MMLPLELQKPLAIFDIESTGLNPRLDRIIELSVFKLFPDKPQKDYYFLLNPEIHIPSETTAIHNITDNDVVNCPRFVDLADELLEIFSNSDLGGFGMVRFDLPMLIEEFTRAGLAFDDSNCRVIDAQHIFHKKEPRDLSAALRFYCGRQHVDAHGAKGDVKATLDVLEAQLKKYPDLPTDMDGFDAFCRRKRDPNWVDRNGRLKWQDDEVTINFGRQQRGVSLRVLAEDNPKYLKWILTSDFPADTKRIVELALQGTFPKRKDDADV